MAPPAPDVAPSIPPSGASNVAARGYGEAIPFTTSAVVPQRLITLLVIGSDARPGEKFTRTRADSLHLVMVNPAHPLGHDPRIPPRFLRARRRAWTDEDQRSLVYGDRS